MNPIHQTFTAACSVSGTVPGVDAGFAPSTNIYGAPTRWEALSNEDGSQALSAWHRRQHGGLQAAHSRRLPGGGDCRPNPKEKGAEEKGRRALQAKKEKAWGFTERPEHPRVRSAQLLILKALQISRNAPQSSWAPWMGDTGVLATLVGRCFPIVSSPKSNLSAKLRE